MPIKDLYFRGLLITHNATCFRTRPLTLIYDGVLDHSCLFTVGILGDNTRTCLVKDSLTHSSENFGRKASEKA